MLVRLPLRVTSCLSRHQCHMNVRSQRLSQCRTLSTSLSSSQPSVSEFFKDQTVIVTGATGFVGQGLVEKLLRSCPDISQIVLPIRVYKNKSVEERYDRFLQLPVFREISRDNPHFGNKLLPVHVDLARADLGLTLDQHDYLSREVSVIIHSAANTYFNPPLSQALRDNLQGTDNVMNFARQCTNLKSIVQISTGFSNFHLDYIKEEVIPVAISMDKMLDFARNPNQKNPVDSKLMGSGMTYVFSKRLTEHLIMEQHNDLPVVICRPCMVSPAISEPYPMWTHGHTSFNVVIPSIADEMLPYVLGDPRVDIEQIPVDVVVNSVLVSCWATGTGQPLDSSHRSPTVVNIHSSSRKPLTLHEFVDIVNDYYEHADLSYRVRLSKNTKTKLLFMQLKQLLIFRLGSFHICRREFKTIVQIESLLSGRDRKDFNTDMRTVDWRHYISQWLDMCRRDRRRR